ncbi:uncharacterized protein LOC121639542 isoform X1 [Melanotaenia boesemani]|uniref:uncharacterized protein LOC121639542 isoform X1 n=1 Tax=Melanotaenia boesemani TaxID=1250792 RepID=UPI001C05DDC4|nr:uncharacterized protein LOC121639542 isoform X1 [Melanotaenia boesemani]
MVLFVIGQMLFLTLLLHAAEENNEWRTHSTPKPDRSVRFGEFCLRIPDDYSQTSSKPNTKQTQTQPSEPVKQETTTPDHPKPEPIESMGKKRPSPYITDSEPAMFPPDHTDQSDGCRCTDKNKKRPTETSQVRARVKWLPSETCSSTEYIEILEDGREVCVSKFSFLTYIDNLIWSLSGLAIEPGSAKLPIAKITETRDYLIDSSENVRTRCIPFISVSWDTFDPKTVQSMDVLMQAIPCPPHFCINLKDKTSFCLDLPELLTVLLKLEKPRHHDGNNDSTPEAIDQGCRCQETAEIHPSTHSQSQKIRVWPSSEVCSSNEFIETLEDGRELCVTASSLIKYFDIYDELADAQTTPKYEKNENNENNEKNDALSLDEAVHFNTETPCHCPFENWNLIESSDVKSLWVLLKPGCPNIFQVIMKDERKFCLDSSQPKFRDLLEKWDM